MRTARLIGVIFGISLAISGCSDPNAERRQQLTMRMNSLQSKMELATQALVQERNRLAYFEREVLTKRGNLNTYKDKVRAYLLNHKMATAAIVLGVGGVAVNIDDQSNFSEDAKAAGAIGAVVAGIYAFNYPDEVLEVADVLVQADANVKHMETEIGQLQAQYSTETSAVQEKQNVVTALGSQLSSLKNEYAEIAP